MIVLSVDASWRSSHPAWSSNSSRYAVTRLRPCYFEQRWSSPQQPATTASGSVSARAGRTVRSGRVRHRNRLVPRRCDRCDRCGGAGGGRRGRCGGHPMVTRVSGEPTAAAPANARSAPLKVEGVRPWRPATVFRVAPPSAHDIDNRVVVTVFEDLRCPALTVRDHVR